MSWARRATRNSRRCRGRGAGPAAARGGASAASRTTTSRSTMTATKATNRRLARRSSGSGAAAWRRTAEEEGVAMRVREERALHRRSRGGVNEDFSAAALRAAEGEEELLKKSVTATLSREDGPLGVAVSGLLITAVHEGGAAHLEGSLAVGDVIVEVNGKDAGMEGELGPLLPPAKATPVRLKVVRYVKRDDHAAEVLAKAKSKVEAALALPTLAEEASRKEVEERRRVLSAAVNVGKRARLDAKQIQRLEIWLHALPPPPEPTRVEAADAGSGGAPDPNRVGTPPLASGGAKAPPPPAGAASAGQPPSGQPTAGQAPVQAPGQPPSGQTLGQGSGQPTAEQRPAGQAAAPPLAPPDAVPQEAAPRPPPADSASGAPPPADPMQHWRWIQPME
uniref:PDZ domain-containing protein n=1 Tax=Emiliania huxleyi TaxID=2903 RepID=A0A7S3SIL6_EMIHU